MAGTYFKLDDRAVRRALKSFMKKSGDLTPVMKDFGEYMLNVSDERFDAQHAPDGTAWVPLKPATLRYKKTDMILTESGNLRKLIYRAHSDSMAYGTNRIYGAIHQFGGRAGRNHSALIPARPYLGMSDADITEYHDALADFLMPA